MKKKYFILRGSSESGPARLEYYDSEKKFRIGSTMSAKRSIVLATCFNINRKVDAKNKHCIALYTRDDCFTIVVEDESQLNEWLELMLELQSQPVDGVTRHVPKPHYGMNFTHFYCSIISFNETASIPFSLKQF